MRVSTHTGPDCEREYERARREIDRERRVRWRRWYVDRGEEKARWTVQSMRCTRQKTMSRGGGQTGGKNTDEAQNPGAAGPSFERLSLSVLPARSSLRAHDAVCISVRVCARSVCTPRGFTERIHEYRVHRDRKDEFCDWATDVEKRSQIIAR